MMSWPCRDDKIGCTLRIDSAAPLTNLCSLISKWNLNFWSNLWNWVKMAKPQKWKNRFLRYTLEKLPFHHFQHNLLFNTAFVDKKKSKMSQKPDEEWFSTVQTSFQMHRTFCLCIMDRKVTQISTFNGLQNYILSWTPLFFS